MSAAGLPSPPRHPHLYKDVMKARVRPVGPMNVIGCPPKAAYAIPPTPHEITYSITPRVPCVTWISAKKRRVYYGVRKKGEGGILT